MRASLGSSVLVLALGSIALAACGDDASSAAGEGGSGTGGSSTSSGMGGTGGHAHTACSDATDCPLPEGECVLRTCDEGMCGTAFALEGSVLTVQTPGDCKRAVCDAQGGVASVDDATDAGDDGNDCTVEACGPSGATSSPAAPGTTCSSGGGKVCDGAGQCVECNDVGQCANGELCSAGQCVPASCSDGVKNGDETALDCGGLCNGCADGQPCLAGGDCANGYCNPAMQCATPTCTDGAKNGMESDVDCGGACPDCANGKSCANNADCASGYCNASMLCAAPTCNDGVKNGSETGTDCGGSCGDCANGQGCLADADCVSGHCLESQCDDLNGCTLATSLDATNQANVVVTFESYSYTPRCLRVKAGTNVTFSGSFPAHPLFGGYLTQGNTFASQGGPFVPMTNTGNSKAFAMNTVGSFPYYCVFHTGQDMAGAVYVVP